MTSGNRPRIVVLDDWERALDRLADWSSVRERAEVRIHHAPLRGRALLAALAEADALVLMRDRTPFDAPLLSRLPRLRYLCFTGTRNTRLDLQALAARGIPVAHTAWGPSKDSTCEHAWALILASTRQVPKYQQALREGRWRPATPEPLPPVLHGERLGVIGLGEIGGRVAAIGRAFGMEVAAWSPRMTAERARQAGATALPLDELLSTSRVVTLHLVPSPDTHHLIDAGRLATMRADALLVNTSRSALVDPVALAAALRAGRPAMAALDVFDDEPLPDDDPLRDAPNLTLTPHLGFVSEPVFTQFAQGVVSNLLGWLDGRAPAP